MAELHGQVVQRSPRVIQKGTKEPREFLEPNGFVGLLDESAVLGFPSSAITLNPYPVRVQIPEVPNPTLKGFTVAIRPFQALPRVSEVVGGAHKGFLDMSEMPEEANCAACVLSTSDQRFRIPSVCQ